MVLDCHTCRPAKSHILRMTPNRSTGLPQNQHENGFRCKIRNSERSLHHLFCSMASMNRRMKIPDRRTHAHRYKIREFYSNPLRGTLGRAVDTDTKSSCMLHH